MERKQAKGELVYNQMDRLIEVETQEDKIRKHREEKRQRKIERGEDPDGPHPSMDEANMTTPRPLDRLS